MDNECPTEYPGGPILSASRDEVIDLINTMDADKLNSLCPGGRSAGFYAMQRPNDACKILAYLIDVGLDLSVCDEHQQGIVFYAAREGHVDCLNLLSKYDTDFEQTDEYSQTALYYASRDGKVDAVRWLVQEANVNINHVDVNGDPAIFYAVRDGREDLVHIMLNELGADVTLKNHRGQSIATIAKAKNRRKLATLLEKMIQEANSRQNDLEDSRKRTRSDRRQASSVSGMNTRSKTQKIERETPVSKRDRRNEVEEDPSLSSGSGTTTRKRKSSARSQRKDVSKTAGSSKKKVSGDKKRHKTNNSDYDDNSNENSSAEASDEDAESAADSDVEDKRGKRQRLPEKKETRGRPRKQSPSPHKSAAVRHSSESHHKRKKSVSESSDAESSAPSGRRTRDAKSHKGKKSRDSGVGRTKGRTSRRSSAHESSSDGVDDSDGSEVEDRKTSQSKSKSLKKESKPESGKKNVKYESEAPKGSKTVTKKNLVPPTTKQAERKSKTVSQKINQEHLSSKMEVLISSEEHVASASDTDSTRDVPEDVNNMNGKDAVEEAPSVEMEQETEDAPPEERQICNLQYLNSSGCWCYACPQMILEFESVFPTVAVWPHDSEWAKLPASMDAYRNEWHSVAQSLMKQLSSVEGAWLFREPVDPDKWGIPEYRTIVERPMDFSTIMNKLREGLEYQTVQDFVSDVELVFYNCILFNSATSEVGAVCLEVRKNFLSYLQSFGISALLDSERQRYDKSEKAIAASHRKRSIAAQLLAAQSSSSATDPSHSGGDPSQSKSVSFASAPTSESLRQLSMIDDPKGDYSKTSSFGEARRGVSSVSTCDSGRSSPVPHTPALYEEATPYPLYEVSAALRLANAADSNSLHGLSSALGDSCYPRADSSLICRQNTSCQNVDRAKCSSAVYVPSAVPLQKDATLGTGF